MDTAEKHYKFINSRTDYVIYYHSLSADLAPEEVKTELDKIKAQVASKNKIFEGTVYWEEIRNKD